MPTTAKPALTPLETELLEALKRALNFIENNEDWMGEKLESGDICRAAIKRAEGR